MHTQADSACALRRSLDSPPAGFQEASPTPSPDLGRQEPPEMFTRLLIHLGHCEPCSDKRPCETGKILARMWLLIEETRERITWL